MAVEIRREQSLAQGMVVVASVRARLLGIKILELDADVAVSPLASPGRNGTIGSSLAGAARSLRASRAELEAARQRMP